LDGFKDSRTRCVARHTAEPIFCDHYAPEVAADAFVPSRHGADYGPHTALLVVDLQNDFADPAGSLYVPGGEQVLDVANAEIERAQAAGAKVAYTQDWHPPETPHFAAQGGIWPMHCVRATWGSAFHPGLSLAGEVVQKGTGGEDGYSAFTVRDPESGHERPTRLLTVLRSRGVTDVVIVGLALDYCVLDTTLDALRLGLRTTVRRAGTRPVELQAGDGERALERMEAAGADLR
jgi:nicotinamidase/pyrazinamidase